eukprot:TRINITY_DN3003_c0_g1_i1.p1 TRINITY_DN3003_c0_g1~~TRINITY_DN3003_c0_g1_i1.p1  ORF type:complete len:204 (+),score=73.96 TRINITY_DN3003_c0_g1_i1:424-1035(+)
MIKTTEEEYFMDYEEAIKHFEKANLPHSKPLLFGTFEECVNYNTKQNSTIPSHLGMDNIEKNQMEGVVIKAVGAKVYVPGKRNQRAIYKIKNEKFEEVNPPAPLTEYEIKRNEERTGVSKALDEYTRYINENRLHSVESKIGPIKEQDSNHVSKLLMEDAFKDFFEDNMKLWISFDEAKKEILMKNFSSIARSFVNEFKAKDE